MDELNIMVGGEAGQGVQSVGYVLAKALLRGGYEIYSDQDYESRIRGGHSFTRIRARLQPVAAALDAVDVLVALDGRTVDVHENDVQAGGIIIFDGSKNDIKSKHAVSELDIPMEKIAVDTTGKTLMTNTVASGAALGVLDFDFEILAEMLRQEYGRKGPEIAEANVKAAKAGYDYAQQKRPESFKLRLAAKKPHGKLLLAGHEALSLGAMAAGCKFVAGYPMTPTTTVLEFIADKGRDYGQIPVIQAEDEISAANMVIGASYAGLRAMTATSGGGFCLMTEALSLCGMIETPMVVVLGQRAGPAIGLPTRTEQSDMLFALFAGHGEFPRAMLAPCDAEDAFWCAVKAFNLAEKYQTLVLIMTDHDIGNSYYTLKKPDLSKVTIDRGDILSAEGAADPNYKRYAITPSGISPRALPGLGQALAVADSDEHNESGHIIEDAETRRAMVDKRMRKLEGLKKEINGPTVESADNSKYNLIGWGSTRGAIKEAAALLSNRGIGAATTHFTELWPFPVDAAVKAMSGGGKNIIIENNATGQLEHLIRAETGIAADGRIHKYDGRPFTATDIVRVLEKEVT